MDNYDGHQPVLNVRKKERGWTIRYRQPDKTLVAMMPEENWF